jgi:uncharacterized integral membrane protein (TIGR00698 family)
MLMKSIPGIGLCVAVGIVARLLSGFMPVGSVAIAIVLGVAIGNGLKPGKLFAAGISFSEKHILAFAVALMGVNLNFMIVRDLGYRSVLIVVSAVAVTVVASLVLAGVFKLNRKSALLLGIGNAICGSSAIAATKDIIGVDEEQVGLSVAIINFLGTIGIFILPFIGTVLLGFSEVHTGLLIGNTLQAVGQVVASGFTVGEFAGQTATIVKMTRILMLTPVVFVLIAVFSRRGSGSRRKVSIPLFIVGFVVFSLVPTFNLLPEVAINIISRISHYALITAMAGIGLKISFSSILRDGKTALMLAGTVFLVQIIYSSSIIYLFIK